MTEQKYTELARQAALEHGADLVGVVKVDDLPEADRRPAGPPENRAGDPLSVAYLHRLHRQPTRKRFQHRTGYQVHRESGYR